jgi:hypothetical protein
MISGNDDKAPFSANVGYSCEISSSHGGEYDVQSCLLGYTVYIPDDGGSTHL